MESRKSELQRQAEGFKAELLRLAENYREEVRILGELIELKKAYIIDIQKEIFSLEVKIRESTFLPFSKRLIILASDRNRF